MSQDFYKIKRLPPYVFEEVNKVKARMRAAGADIIDFGMGNPDLPVPPHIIDKLCEAARKPRTNRYSASRGVAGLRKAMAGYYDRRFNVKLNPDTQVVATLGSKEGFANLAQAITAPGDVIISPNPSYPIHAFGFIMAGGVIRSIEAHSPEQYLAGIDRAVRHSTPHPIAMVTCYPANPTAQSVGLDFYKEAVRLAKKYDMFVLSDLAYSEIYFEGDPPPSILQVEGAMDVAVEVNTLSKTYSMAGFRVGFALGNERLISALARVKSYLDYGAYTPIQVAAAAALNGPQDCVEDMRQTYKARRDVLLDSFAKAGWTLPKPSASMFVWAEIPERFRHLGSVGFAKQLMEGAEFAVAPGAGFGEYGDNYVRIALVENEQRIRQAARSLKKFLASNAPAIEPSP
ncbi:MAG: LL-diaminopimelate aminotransferase [Hyphomonadaceae bacterium]|nr:LL-diaminopimelate aminotransferase [Hyphomonadaceae bacterium]